MGLPAQLRFAGLVCWLLRSLAISIHTCDGSSVGFLCLDCCWGDVLGRQVLSVSITEPSVSFLVGDGWRSIGSSLVEGAVAGAICSVAAVPLYAVYVGLSGVSSK